MIIVTLKLKTNSMDVNIKCVCVFRLTCKCMLCIIASYIILVIKVCEGHLLCFVIMQTENKFV
jgi:hypothetical protein